MFIVGTNDKRFWLVPAAKLGKYRWHAGQPGQGMAHKFATEEQAQAAAEQHKGAGASPATVYPAR